MEDVVMQLQHNPWLVRYLLLALTVGIPTGIAQVRPQLALSDWLATLSSVVGLWLWLWPYWRPRWPPSPTE
jgi:hypothetical protein